MSEDLQTMGITSFLPTPHAVVNDPTQPALARLTAHAILHSPAGIYPVGEWIKTLSDIDLCVVSSAMDESAPDPSPRTKFVVTLIGLLAHGEGVLIESAEHMELAFSHLNTYLLLEKLARQGQVRINYANLTLGEDGDDLKIAERL